MTDKWFGDLGPQPFEPPYPVERKDIPFAPGQRAMDFIRQASGYLPDFPEVPGPTPGKLWDYIRTQMSGEPQEGAIVEAAKDVVPQMWADVVPMGPVGGMAKKIGKNVYDITGDLAKRKAESAPKRSSVDKIGELMEKLKPTPISDASQKDTVTDIRNRMDRFKSDPLFNNNKTKVGQQEFKELEMEEADLLLSEKILDPIFDRVPKEYFGYVGDDAAQKMYALEEVADIVDDPKLRRQIEKAADDILDLSSKDSRFKPWDKAAQNLKKVLQPQTEIEQSVKDRFSRLYKDDNTLVDTFEKKRIEGHDEPYFGRSFAAVKYGNRSNPTVTALDGATRPNVPVYNIDPDTKHIGKQLSEGGVDPFDWVDHKDKATKEFLKKRTGPITMETRSDLITQDDYMNLLDKNDTIIFHVLGDNERVVRNVEPGAPSLLRRMDAIKKLRDNGFRVEVVNNRIQGMDQRHFDLKEIWKDLAKMGVPVRDNLVEVDAEQAETIRRILGDIPEPKD